MVTVRLVTGDNPPAAGAPNRAFTVGCGVGGELQAKSRRRRCGCSGPSSMAAPSFPGLPLRLPPPPPRPPRRHRPQTRATPPAPAGQTQTRPRGSGTWLPRASGADGRVSGTPPPPPGARHLHGCFPLTPARPEGERAGACNLKIKSKQTWRAEKGERKGASRQRPGLTLHTFLSVRA
jgi:hypothetical protein